MYRRIVELLGEMKGLTWTTYNANHHNPIGANTAPRIAICRRLDILLAIHNKNSECAGPTLQDQLYPSPPLSRVQHTAYKPHPAPTARPAPRECPLRARGRLTPIGRV